MSIEYYTYELKRSRLGKAFGDKVAIREDWVKRTRRYVVAQGLDLNKLALFVKKGLFDRRVDGFNQQALSEPLSSAQQWTLMFVILSDFGVPEWLRDPTKDENTPDMEVAEPEEEDESVTNAILSAPTSVATGLIGLTASVTTATIDAGKSVGETAIGVAATPVKSLSGLMSGAAVEAAEAIQEADAVISGAVADDVPAEDTTEDVPAEDVPAEETTETDAGEGQSGE